MDKALSAIRVPVLKKLEWRWQSGRCSMDRNQRDLDNDKHNGSNSGTRRVTGWISQSSQCGRAAER